MCVVIAQFVVDEILKTEQNMQLNDENQLAQLEIYWFGCDEHVPWCQCSDSM